jgi:hypothetical protein
MRYTVDLEWEQVDALVRKELLDCYENFKDDKRPSSGIFSTDKDEDLREMKKMRKAIKLILDWYGEKV